MYYVLLKVSIISKPKVGGNPPIIRTMRSASQVISICPFCRTYDACYANVWGDAQHSKVY